VVGHDFEAEDTPAPSRPLTRVPRSHTIRELQFAIIILPPLVSLLHLAAIRAERSHAEGRAIVCEVVGDRRGDERDCEGTRDEEEGGRGEHGGAGGWRLAVGLAAVLGNVKEGGMGMGGVRGLV
jgi:hypothetical protein